MRSGLRYLAFLLVAVIALATFTPLVGAQEKYYVKVSLRSDLLTMNPFMQSLTDEYSVMELVYDTLFRQAPNGSFVPWLAEKVEIKDGGETWIFHIRKGVKWHDGTELTAEDVAFTLNYTVRYRFPTRSTVWQPIEEVKVLDKYTVTVKLKYPYAAFPSALANLFIVKKEKWEKIEDPMTYSNFENPIGTGPFKWGERKPGDYIRLDANPDYWAGPPKIDGVIFKIFKSSDAAYMATVKGEIDAMNNLFIPPHLIKKAEEEVKKNPALGLHFRKPIYFQYITVMLNKYPFSIKKFREAMLYAIDVNTMVKVVYGGHADPGSLGTLPPVFGEMPQKWYRPGLEKEKLYPFNLTKAKEILDELGFIDRDGDGVRETPNGTKLEFELLASSIYPDRVRIAELVRDWFKEIGIKINVKVLDHRTVVTRFLNREFDMVVIGIWLSEPDDWFLVLHSSGAVKGSFNAAMYKNPEVDKLLEEQRYTVDVEKRREILWKLQELVAKDIPYLVLVHIHEAYLYRVDRFKGWVLSKIMAPAQFWSFINLEPIEKEVGPGPAPTATPASPSTSTPSTMSPTTTSSPAVLPTVTTPRTSSASPTGTTSAAPSVSTVTVVRTETVTQTRVESITTTVATTQWTTTIAIGIVLLITGFAIGYTTRRR